MKILKPIAIVIIILGTIGIALNIFFKGQAIGFLEYHETAYVQYYTYNFHDYFLNLKQSLNNYDKLTLTIPVNDFSGFVEGLTTIANYLIMMINILLYPIRIGAYVGKILLSLIGFNMTNPIENTQWLVQFIDSGINLQIGYIIIE